MAISTFPSALTIMSKVSELAKKQPRQSWPLMFVHLHAAPKHNLTSPEYNLVYVHLINLYKLSDHIDNRLASPQLFSDEPAIFEKAISRFLDIAREFEAGTTVLPPFGAVAKVKECVPFAKFYAGIFALARGEKDKAAICLLEAEGRWGLKPDEIADLILKNPNQAKEKLGERFKSISDRFKTLPLASAAEMAGQRPPVTKIVPPKEPEQLLSAGDKTNLVAAAIKEGKELLTKEQPEEALARVVSAKEFVQTEAESLELEHLEARCLNKLGRDSEALTILNKTKENNPRYLQTGETRLLVYLGLKMRKEGFDLIKTLEKKRILAAFEILVFRARFIALDLKIENLERVQDILAQAARAAEAARRSDIAKEIGLLAARMQKDFLAARTARSEEKKKEEAAVPSATPQPQPASPAQSVAPIVVPDEIIAREKALAARESNLTAREGLMAGKEELLTQEFANLRAATERLVGDRDELRRQKLDLETRTKQRTVVEVGKITVNRKPTMKEHDIHKACHMIGEGKFAEAAGALRFLKENSQSSALIDTLLKLLDLLDKNDSARVAEVKRLAGQIESLTLELQTERERNVRLAGEIIARRTEGTTFGAVWAKLLTKNPAELKVIDPVLAELFEVAATDGPRTFKPAEVIGRRKELIGIIVNELRSTGRVSPLTQLKDRYPDIFSSVPGNKRILPGGYRQLGDWARAIAELIV